MRLGPIKRKMDAAPVGCRAACTQFYSEAGGARPILEKSGERKRGWHQCWECKTFCRLGRKLHSGELAYADDRIALGQDVYPVEQRVDDILATIKAAGTLAVPGWADVIRGEAGDFPEPSDAVERLSTEMEDRGGF